VRRVERRDKNLCWSGVFDIPLVRGWTERSFLRKSLDRATGRAAKGAIVAVFLGLLDIDK